MRLSTFLILWLLGGTLYGQNSTIEGYVFEDDNRGYLGMALVKLMDSSSQSILDSTYTSSEGYFKMTAPKSAQLKVSVEKDMFSKFEQDIFTEESKVFVSAKMTRVPGYIFEITLAEKKGKETEVSKAIKDAKIEVYNNTTKEITLDILKNPYPEFKVNLLKGNHYTILIRKDSFLTKRMEAFVNVNGCILCFEGVGDVRPGVVDNLSGSNTIGMLLANVELDRIAIDKLVGFANIYYASGSAELNSEGKKELDKVAMIAKDNPNILFELGSHTDYVGDERSNLILSENRAKSVVEYLVNKKDVRKNQLISKGYGETKPINNCNEQNPCSSSELAKNRRTELKIIGISDEIREMSLKEIKTIEEFEEELMQSIQSSTQDTHSTDKKDTNIASYPEDTNITNSHQLEKSTETELIIKELKSAENTNTEIEKNSKYFLIQAGKFATKDDANFLLDKLLLLGYSHAYIVENDSVFTLVVDKTYQAEDALHVIDDLIKNDVNARIIEY
ncbi:MAG: OmpA family protein [Lewinellaceae bacterium]|nr:OmpA family protein [Lewinellaceae bacterium]